MRSVFSDYSDIFLQILTYKKEEWNIFWHEYKKQKPKVVNEFLTLNGLSDEEAIKKLMNLERRDLDRAFWYREETSFRIKGEIIKMLTHNPKKFELDRGDYSVQIFCFFGEKPYYYIDTYAGTVIAIDYLYFYNHRNEITLQEIIEKSILEFLSKFPHDEKKARFWITLDLARKIINDNEDYTLAMSKIVQLLDKRIPYFNWTGFYMIDPNERDTLVVGPYVGETTEHVRIKVGKGICGQAAENKATFVVGDVSKEANYLSCSDKTKSEIVVPLFDQKGNVIGEIDIDSHTIDPFDDKDVKFLEEIASLLTNKYFEKYFD